MVFFKRYNQRYICLKNYEKSIFSMNLKKAVVFLSLFFLIGCTPSIDNNEIRIKNLVYKHALAWQTGDIQLLDEVLHQDVIFAYPGRRLNKQQTLEDLQYFRDHFKNTEVYIHNIIIDKNKVAVEWQFATTKTETNQRQVVSDAIIAEVKDNKFIIWKEYLDGRVKLLQADGILALEEGKEPFPWPLKK